MEIAGIKAVLTAETKDFNRGVEFAANNLDKLGSSSRRADSDLLDLNGAVSRVAGAMTILAAVDFAVDLVKQTIQVTSEFGKLQSALSQTLQSAEAGRDAFLVVQDFAANTNVEVAELTEVMLKLANRGVNVGTASLMAMADVANTLNKPLKQLNEAILDVTNSRRWTELGISVESSGDKIIGSFRGQRFEFEATEAGALKMIEAISRLPGVQGATEAAAKTLAGELNNLSDSYDNLLFALGNTAPFREAAKGLRYTFDEIRKGVEGIDVEIERAAATRVDQNTEALKDRLAVTIDLYRKQGKTAKEAAELAVAGLEKELDATKAVSKAELERARDRLKIAQNSVDNNPTAGVANALDFITGAGVVTDIDDLQEKKAEFALAEADVKSLRIQYELLDEAIDGINEKPVISEEALKANEKLQSVIAQINADYANAAVSANVFNTENELGEKQINILTRGIERLIGEGLRPGDAALDSFVNKLNRLSAAAKAAVPLIEPLSSIGQVTGFDTLVPEIDIESRGFEEMMKNTGRFADALSEQLSPLATVVQDANAKLQAAFLQVGETVAAGVGQIIGTLAAGGEISGREIVGFLGKIASQLGGALLAIGAPLLAVPGAQAQALRYLIPGGLLVAAGAALSAGNVPGKKSSPFANVQGGFSGQTSSSGSGGGPRSPVDSSVRQSAVSGSSNITVDISGSTLRIIPDGDAWIGYLERVQSKIKKTGG